jgi:hypothetical protein
VLPKQTEHKPEKIPEWDLALTSCEIEDIKELLALVTDLKRKDLTRGSVAMSFCRRLI